MTLPSKRDVAIIQATVRRIAGAATLASEKQGFVPLRSFHSALAILASDPLIHQRILKDVAEDAYREE